MSVIGHQELTRVLAEELPPVALFLGPASVGKWTTAEWLRREHTIDDGDLLRIRRLTADDARTLVRFATTAPMKEKKLAIVRLDRATPPAQHILLKTLEEIPDTSKVILIAENPPLPTVTSRSTVYPFRLLTTDEVTEILLRRKFQPTEAKRLAELSGGHVQQALTVAESMEFKVTVLAAVRALRERDAGALDNLAGKWSDEHTELLAQLCREAITYKWRIFSDAEVEGMGRKLPMQILRALRPNVRPRLVIRASLMSILRGE